MLQYSRCIILEFYIFAPTAQKGREAGLPGACSSKMPNSVLRKEKFGFYTINFDGLKKGQPLNKFSKISRPTNFKKGQICFFCLEKSTNLATLAREGKKDPICVLASVRSRWLAVFRRKSKVSACLRLSHVKLRLQ